MMGNLAGSPLPFPSTLVGHFLIFILEKNTFNIKDVGFDFSMGGIIVFFQFT